MNELQDLKEMLLEDVISYFEKYENNIPFTYTQEQQETFIDDICLIIVEKINKLIESHN